MKSWNAQKTGLAERLADGGRYASGKTVEVEKLPNFLEAVIRPADRVCLEGDNQKQADVLAAAFTDVDPAKIHDLHMVQSGVVLPEHLDVFEKGIARRLDYSYSGRSRRASPRFCSAAKSSWGRCTPILSCSTLFYRPDTCNGAIGPRRTRFWANVNATEPTRASEVEPMFATRGSAFTR
jgi:malonate decarboxylase alpha subunit